LNFEKELRDGRDKLYAVGGSEVMSYIFTDYREITKASFFAKLNYSLETIFADGPPSVPMEAAICPGHHGVSSLQPPLDGCTQ
jgi:hypothetical protein